MSALAQLFASPFLSLGWLPEEWSMYAAYFVCAVVGGTILLLQIGLSLLGLGDHDVDGDGIDADHDFDHEHGAGLPVLSIRAITSALLMFGLVGMIGSTEEWGTAPTIALSSLSGLTVLLLVAWVIKLQMKLTQSGSEDPRLAVLDGPAKALLFLVSLDESIATAVMGTMNVSEGVAS